MTYKDLHVRSGLAAIAAVLALSSTPLAAQDTTDPLAPAPEAVAEPAPAAEAAPEPTAAEPTATDTRVTEGAPAETAAPATTRRTATRARTAAPSRTASAPVRSAAPASPVQGSEQMAESTPVPPPPAAPIADPMMAPPVEEPVAEVSAMPTDDALAVAGAAGLGLLALGGLGLAVGRRRRRREEQAHYAANQQYLHDHPAEDSPAAAEPAFARSAPRPAMAPAMAAASAVRTDVPRTNLPSGFDLSRFGPHVRAAYQGPTEDNPSLSLKHRLRRAAAMDQRARLHGEAPSEAVRTAVRPDAVRADPARPDAARKPVWNAEHKGLMFRPARTGPRTGQPSRLAFQK